MTISEFKDLFNILFFIVVGTVTILSYFQAKKSLFSPIRTETFKLQLQIFEKILLYFQNNSESDFDKRFDLDNILKLNNLKMLDEYIQVFFGQKGDEKVRNELFGQFVGGVVSKEKMNKLFLHVPLHNSDFINTEESFIKKENWHNYEYIAVQFTKKYSDEIKELENLSASPLLPNNVRRALKDFEETVHFNLQVIGEVVEEVAKTLPTESPKFNDVSNINHSGVWNIYNNKKKSLEEKAEIILKTINSYLNVEKLIEQ